MAHAASHSYSGLHGNVMVLGAWVDDASVRVCQQRVLAYQ